MEPWALCVTNVGNQPHCRLQRKQSASRPLLSSWGLRRVPSTAITKRLGRRLREIPGFELCTASRVLTAPLQRGPDMYFLLTCLLWARQQSKCFHSINLATVEENPVSVLPLLTPSTDQGNQGKEACLINSLKVTQVIHARVWIQTQVLQS